MRSLVLVPPFINQVYTSLVSIEKTFMVPAEFVEVFCHVLLQKDIACNIPRDQNSEKFRRGGPEPGVGIKASS